MTPAQTAAPGLIYIATAVEPGRPERPPDKDMPPWFS